MSAVVSMESNILRVYNSPTQISLAQIFHRYKKINIMKNTSGKQKSDTKSGNQQRNKQMSKGKQSRSKSMSNNSNNRSNNK